MATDNAIAARQAIAIHAAMRTIPSFEVRGNKGREVGQDEKPVWRGGHPATPIMHVQEPFALSHSCAIRLRAHFTPARPAGGLQRRQRGFARTLAASEKSDLNSVNSALPLPERYPPKALSIRSRALNLDDHFEVGGRPGEQAADEELVAIVGRNTSVMPCAVMNALSSIDISGCPFSNTLFRIRYRRLPVPCRGAYSTMSPPPPPDVTRRLRSSSLMK